MCRILPLPRSFCYAITVLSIIIGEHEAVSNPSGDAGNIAHGHGRYRASSLVSQQRATLPPPVFIAGELVLLLSACMFVSLTTYEEAK